MVKQLQMITIIKEVIIEKIIKEDINQIIKIIINKAQRKVSE